MLLVMLQQVFIFNVVHFTDYSCCCSFKDTSIVFSIKDLAAIAVVRLKPHFQMLHVYACIFCIAFLRYNLFCFVGLKKKKTRNADNGGVNVVCKRGPKFDHFNHFRVVKSINVRSQSSKIQSLK